jgi:hypothetical protein
MHQAPRRRLLGVLSLGPPCKTLLAPGSAGLLGGAGGAASAALAADAVERLHNRQADRGRLPSLPEQARSHNSVVYTR